MSRSSYWVKFEAIIAEARVSGVLIRLILPWIGLSIAVRLIVAVATVVVKIRSGEEKTKILDNPMEFEVKSWVKINHRRLAENHKLLIAWRDILVAENNVISVTQIPRFFAFCFPTLFFSVEHSNLTPKSSQQHQHNHLAMATKKVFLNFFWGSIRQRHLDVHSMVSAW